MSYFDELDRINEEIRMIKNHSEYLLINMEEIEEKNNLQLEEEEHRKLEPGDLQISSINTKKVLGREIDELKQDILRLKDRREEMIRTILNAAKLSIQETLCLMDKFGSYYRIEVIGNKTFIVPQAFYLVRHGLNSIAEEEELNELACQYNHVDCQAKKSATTAPMYKKTSKGIQINDQILTSVAGLEVNDFEGVQIYKREGNEIIFNGKILNLFPYDVVAFLDYLVISRFEHPRLSMDEAWKQYRVNNQVLAFSQDDPSLEDIYRTKK